MASPTAALSIRDASIDHTSFEVQDSFASPTRVSANSTIKALVSQLKGFRPGAPLKHYIAYARFPNFKGLERGARIDFEFPLTALVGPNGIGKSSVLHALWGMPYGYSTSKFWFATDLDPIAENQSDPPRYFYAHWSDALGGLVETRKARIGRKRGPDYWEPARRSAADGMKALPVGKYEGKSNDRWNPVKREVIYINLKASIGSFDRYFYFDNDTSSTNIRAEMLREATRLKSIVDKNKISYKLGGYERLFENRELSAEELEQVARILGRTYSSARLVRHSLYPRNRGRDLSVVFRRGIHYSEAFAGSGEVAAVNVTVQLLAAPEFALVLLDEPETSLHPGAQRELLRFLLEQIKLKKLQVIVSTHSSEFIRGLPTNAIKVFEESGPQRTRILPRSTPAAAFMRLGKAPESLIRVLVEDQLAAIVVSHAARALDPGDAARVEVVVAPGGAESILKYIGPAQMLSRGSVFVLLDGDKRKVSEFTDPTHLPAADHGTLGKLFVREMGCEPLLNIPGGTDTAGNEQAKIEAQLSYLSWVRNRVRYLPRRIPEEIVLAANGKLFGDDATTSEIKAAFRSFVADNATIQLSAIEISALAKVKVSKIDFNLADIDVLRLQLQEWLSEEEVSH